MTALNWKIVPGHEAQWRADIFRTNATGEVRIFQGDQCWHANATIEGHHYEADFAIEYSAREVRGAAGRWIDRIIAVQQADISKGA